MVAPLTAQQVLPSTTDFMNSFGVCAVEKSYKINSDIEESIKKFYETRRTQGTSELTKSGEFLSLFPPEKRADMYTIYVNCILAILNKQSSLPPKIIGTATARIDNTSNDSTTLFFDLVNEGLNDIRQMNVSVGLYSTLKISPTLGKDPGNFCVRQYFFYPEDKCEPRNKEGFKSIVEIEKNVSDLMENLVVSSPDIMASAWTTDADARFACEFFKKGEQIRVGVTSALRFRGKFGPKDCPDKSEEETGHLIPWRVKAQAEAEGGGAYIDANVDGSDFKQTGNGWSFVRASSNVKPKSNGPSLQ
jgi:hypothetical protein